MKALWCQQTLVSFLNFSDVEKYLCFYSTMLYKYGKLILNGLKKEENTYSIAFKDAPYFPGLTRARADCLAVEPHTMSS